MIFKWIGALFCLRKDPKAPLLQMREYMYMLKIMRGSFAMAVGAKPILLIKTLNGLR